MSAECGVRKSSLIPDARCYSVAGYCGFNWQSKCDSRKSAATNTRVKHSRIEIHCRLVAANIVAWQNRNMLENDRKSQ
jgi:hypothetical protein